MKPIRSLFREILRKNYWSNLVVIFLVQSILAILVATSLIAFAQHLVADYIKVVIQRTEGAGYQVLFSNQMESLVDVSRTFAPIKFDIEIYHDGRPKFLSNAPSGFFRVPINYRFQVDGLGSPYQVLISADIGPFILGNFLAFIGLFLVVSLHFRSRVKKSEKSFAPIITDIVSLIEKIEGSSRALQGDLKVGEKIETSIVELAELQKSFDRFVIEINSQRESLRKLSYAEATSQIASQVAHDIRSPLSALNMVASTLTEVSDEKRQIIRTVSTRINDIANNLLDHMNSPLRIVDLNELVRSLVQEKQIQFSDRPHIKIGTDLRSSTALLSRVHVSDLGRALSNLINNSIEAVDKGDGSVTVSALARVAKNEIRIVDNGRGIPADVLSQLGNSRISYGKDGAESGFGLGVFQARQAVENMGGEFSIESALGNGTTVIISLPKETV